MKKIFLIPKTIFCFTIPLHKISYLLLIYNILNSIQKFISLSPKGAIYKNLIHSAIFQY